MAAGTNTFQTYQTIGIREDLIDTITNISPSENWFTKNSGMGKKATATYHEWQTDVLPTATANAHVEGEVASASAITPTVRTGNYTQILVQDFSVTEHVRPLPFLVSGAYTVQSSELSLPKWRRRDVSRPCRRLPSARFRPLVGRARR